MKARALRLDLLQKSKKKILGNKKKFLEMKARPALGRSSFGRILTKKNSEI